MRGCALLSVTLATASCSWLQSLDKDQTLDWSAEKLYSEARVALDDSNWTQAKDYYQKLEARYPFGQYAQQAQKKNRKIRKQSRTTLIPQQRRTANLSC